VTARAAVSEAAAFDDVIPPEAFLAAYPDGIRAAAEILRAIVRRAVPDAVERVRPGWRLIGYDLPVGRRSVFFAFVAPEPIHVHLGFQHGIFMTDPDRMLEDAHLRLKKVRFVTFEAGDAIPEAALEDLTLEAARLAAMTREERFAFALDRDWAPGDVHLSDGAAPAGRDRRLRENRGLPIGPSAFASPPERNPPER
jgi:hypothetical protein